MFHSMRQSILARMHYLEQIDVQDRIDGTPQMQRLRQITPDTGRFLALLVANAPDGALLEIGTSAGYSTLWLGIACETVGRTVTTFEFLPEKAQLARETFQLTQMEGVIQLVEGDARSHLTQVDTIAFCFLDAEKELYGELYEAVIPKLVRGGLLVADNVVDQRDALEPMIERALADERVDSVIVPIGNGELVCRKI